MSVARVPLMLEVVLVPVATVPLIRFLRSSRYLTIRK